MPLTLPLTADLEQRLNEEARRLNVGPTEWVLRLLDQHLPLKDRGPDVVALVQSWLDEDNAEEQKQTGDYLIEALDADRMSDRKLYPPDLEGVTW